MPKTCAVPFHAHWCCWLWVSLKVQVSLEDFFLCRNQETLREQWGILGIWGPGWIRLGYYVVSMCKFNLNYCQVGVRERVSQGHHQVLAVENEATNQNSKNPLQFPVPWE